MKNKKYIAIIALIVGVVSFSIALLMDIILPEWSEYLGSAKYVFVGLGAGIAGASASKVITQYMYKKNPEMAKQARINENDERYVDIRKTSAYYMWYVTIFSLCTMSLIFVFMDLMVATLISLSVMAIHIVGFFALAVKINKKA